MASPANDSRSLKEVQQNLQSFTNIELVYDMLIELDLIEPSQKSQNLNAALFSQNSSEIKFKNGSLLGDEQNIMFKYPIDFIDSNNMKASMIQKMDSGLSVSPGIRPEPQYQYNSVLDNLDVKRESGPSM